MFCSRDPNNFDDIVRFHFKNGSSCRIWAEVCLESRTDVSSVSSTSSRKGRRWSAREFLYENQDASFMVKAIQKSLSKRI